MDYTSSNSFAVDAGTGNRMHQQSSAIPTAVSDADLNQVIWSLMEVVKAAGMGGVAFNPAVPATYQRLLSAIQVVAANSPVTDIVSAIKYREATFSGCACLVEL